jgi:hypothetical protein
MLKMINFLLLGGLIFIAFVFFTCIVYKIYHKGVLKGFDTATKTYKRRKVEDKFTSTKVVKLKRIYNLK